MMTIVAVTGIVLVLFVIGHMIGNLTVFFGRDVINAYAMHLRDLGPLLWLIRLFMLASVILHIWFTMLVWKENIAAHPQKYAVFAPMTTTIFARTMRLTGLILLAFIVFHLAHFSSIPAMPTITPSCTGEKCTMSTEWSSSVFAIPSSASSTS